MHNADGTTTQLPAAIILQRPVGSTAGIVRARALIATNGVNDDTHALWQLDNRTCRKRWNN